MHDTDGLSPPSCRRCATSFSFATAPMSPALQLGHRDLLLALQQLQLADALLVIAGRVPVRRVGLERAGVDAEERDAAGERIGEGLEHQRGREGLGAAVERDRLALRDPSRRSSSPRRRRGSSDDERVEDQRGRRCCATRTRRAPGRSDDARPRASGRRCSSSCDSPPCSKKRSISVSSPSATFSISFSRQSSGLGLEVGGDVDRSRYLPEPSAAYLYAFIETRSMTP